MEFLLRKAEAEDLAGIMQVMESTRAGMEHPQWFVADDEEYIKAHLCENGFAIVAESPSGETAGFFLIKYPSREENLGTHLNFTEEALRQTAIMDSAAVAPKYRGNHLQSQMLEAAEQHLIHSDYRHLLCTIHPDNRYSLQTMQSHAYQIQKTITCYGGLTRHLLQKDLP